MSRETGVVKLFIADKGYGFIGVPGMRDVFVHQNDVVTEIGRDLIEGDKLDFELQMHARGPQAVDVEVVKAFKVRSDAAARRSNRGHHQDDDGTEPGLFIPRSPQSAARVIAQHYDTVEIEELADQLLLRGK